MKKLFFIGLAQAISVIAYCALIAVTFNFLGKSDLEPPKIFGFIVMLVILVFSAAATGSIVFGYPAYLFFKHGKIKEPLLILVFTALCSLVILIAGIIIYLIK